MELAKGGIGHTTELTEFETEFYFEETAVANK